MATVIAALTRIFRNWQAKREANRLITVIGRDGNPLTIPNHLAQDAWEAELIDAGDHFEKHLVWHDDWKFVIGFDTLRSVIEIAHDHDDPEIALIAVAANLIDFHDPEEDDDE